MFEIKESFNLDFIGLHNNNSHFIMYYEYCTI